MYKLLIYGAGNEYKKLVSCLKKNNDFYIDGIVTTLKQKEQVLDGYRMYTLDEIGIYSFDYIIIAILEWEGIVESLRKKGIKDEKIILSADFYKYNSDFKQILEKKFKERSIKDDGYYLNLKYKEKEYLKESVLHYPPTHITIGITSACKNKCLFCSYHGEEFKEFSNVYGLSYMMSLNDFKNIVDISIRGNVKKIHICGTGEPFTNPQIFEMMDYVINSVGKVSFQTEFWNELFERNNYLKEICKRAKCIESITTDIISADESIHNKIKKGNKLQDLIYSLKYISEHSDIMINANMILTQKNAVDIWKIIDMFVENNIKNISLNICNLFSYHGAKFASQKNLYLSNDIEITIELKKAQEYGFKHGINVNVPEPADSKQYKCTVFWEKLQIWPVKGAEKIDNMINHACTAVVNGSLNSLGNLLDYNNIMDAWNNEKIVEIRRNLIEGKYPSEYCKQCYCYSPHSKE